MDFGYSPSLGWVTATYPLVLVDLQERYQAATTANTDVEHGPAADMLRTVAGLANDLWADQLGAYVSKFITQAPGTDGIAQGSALEVNLTPKIGPKLSATPSTVIVTLFAAAGPNVAVPAGSSITLDQETAPWTLDAPVLIPGGGSIDGAFTFSEDGPKRVIAASSWGILTPVTGWASAGPNAAAAIEGRFAETDDEYRTRYRESLRDNLVSEVRMVSGVTSASTIEWPYGAPDAFWGLTHWVELLVVGGDNTLVAEAIHRTRAKGVKTVGNITIAVADSDYVGGQWDESFSRPANIPTFVKITVTKGEGYPGDTSPDAVQAREDAIFAGVAAHYALLVAGSDTSGFAIGRDVGAAVKPTIPGIANLAVLVDTVSPPVNAGVLAAAIREILTIAVVDTTIVGA